MSRDAGRHGASCGPLLPKEARLVLPPFQFAKHRGRSGRHAGAADSSSAHSDALWAWIKPFVFLLAVYYTFPWFLKTWLCFSPSGAEAFLVFGGFFLTTYAKDGFSIGFATCAFFCGSRFWMVWLGFVGFGGFPPSSGWASG